MNVRESVRQAIFKSPKLPEPTVRASLRKLAGITQTNLAEIVGCTRRMIWQYENGYANPTGERLVRYSEALEAMKAEMTD